MTADSRALEQGTYTLVVEVSQATRVEVGALGAVEMDAGLYAYTGSARGPGGFARLDRHLRTLRGESDVRRWHVDYLAARPEVSATAAVTSTAGECEVAGAVEGSLVPGFGCSDCGCASHLHGVEGVAPVVEAHEAASDVVSVKSYGGRARSVR